MERNFETVMLEQCAPVLASLKPGGLFRYETRDSADLARRVKNWNVQLEPKGLRVRVLKGCVLTHRYLVYVYRANRLAAVLQDPAVRNFLARTGYRLPRQGQPWQTLLDQLSQRLCCEGEFPHEIGVFLGYPLNDLKSFINDPNEGCLLVGEWKVYHDREEAEKLFGRYNSCRKALVRQITERGKTLAEIFAAA